MTLTPLPARKNGNNRGAGAERLSGSETWKLNNAGKRIEKSVEISETRCRQVFRDISVSSIGEQFGLWIME